MIRFIGALENDDVSLVNENLYYISNMASVITILRRNLNKIAEIFQTDSDLLLFRLYCTNCTSSVSICLEGVLHGTAFFG